jgi:hypothetical protein
MSGPLSGKRAADSRAHTLAPTIRKLIAAGSLSRRALADKLNRRRIPTARGGRWQHTTVVRMLTRLTSFSAIAAELDAREIPITLGGKWHLASVKRVLQREGNAWEQDCAGPNI